MKVIYMKKKLTVKQKHLYTQQSKILYSGTMDLYKKDNHARISYIEDGNACKVMLDSDENMLNLERISTDIHTRLSFINKEYTSGSIESAYGVIDVQIYTHKYIRKDDVIALEYDILINGEVTDGYRIIWNYREGIYESN